MDEKIVHCHSTWKICEKNSLGTDFDSLANVQIMVNKDNVDAGSFLDIVDMENYLYFTSSESEERCIITISAHKGTLSNINLVTDARNIEIFTADSGQVTSYWKTFRGKFIDELSELGSETYMHEISFDCAVRHVEFKLGKTTDTNLYLFGLKIYVTPANDSKQRNIPFQQNNIDFNHVESMLSNSSVPLTPGAERALQFLKNSGGALTPRTSPPNMDMIMNLINQSASSIPSPLQQVQAGSSENSASSSNSAEIMLIKSYLDVRLKEMQDTIINGIDQKFKDLEERQNQKFNQIFELLRR